MIKAFNNTIFQCFMITTLLIHVTNIYIDLKMEGVFWNIFPKVSAWNIVNYFDYEAVLKNNLVWRQEKEIIWKYNFANIRLLMCVWIASTTEIYVISSLSRTAE